MSVRTPKTLLKNTKFVCVFLVLWTNGPTDYCRHYAYAVRRAPSAVRRAPYQAVTHKPFNEFV